MVCSDSVQEMNFSQIARLPSSQEGWLYSYFRLTIKVNSIDRRERTDSLKGDFSDLFYWEKFGVDVHHHDKRYSDLPRLRLLAAAFSLSDELLLLLSARFRKPSIPSWLPSLSFSLCFFLGIVFFFSGSEILVYVPPHFN
jgi:hypothetical protein